ncbi:helix-turn-helix transcriptional regulator [Plantactinospora sp. S1510]|uniref:Helix-turn-helix transcriptional regulator n=1 Tax=Plantactinospora alkalitolerans TaxID=2789879 RepID=A0ABS0H4H7_9ACTN|nr:helix-turn-helix transcriptional regulator [Plantactinospora alkalitolerans]MBF9133032.1 helix-turn-helix transcriptional regulator [Plantactinospora alkalitolerans]
MDAASPSGIADSMATRQFQRELRRWRTRKGLTQRALADRVRFSRETVAAVEAGRRYGSQELAVRCDEALGTGGLLTALWPRVALEQLAADGRRGPRGTDAGRPAAERGPDPRHDPQSVVEAIDELRELIDHMLRIHAPAEQHRHPEADHDQPSPAGDPAVESRPQPAEPRRPAGESHRPFTESHRRGRVGALGRRP